MPRTLLTLFFLLSVAITPLAHTSAVRAQDEQKDLREAAYTAGQILQLASDRKFNAMYDYIHPDAHAVVPRVAAVGAFEKLYGAYQVGQAEIYDGRMTSYTYPVTGKTYPYAAEFNFRQPYVDDQGNQQTLEDKIVLVKAEGEWRWFFGSSPEFVDTVVKQFGMPAAAPITQGDLVKNVAEDLDAFYKDVLSYTDFRYVSPGFVYVPENTSVRTECGPAQPGFLAFFCPKDVTIYVEQRLIDQLSASGQPFTAAFVIAHEWAHHVQTLVTFDRVQNEPRTWNEVWSIELELMADCMAGAWAQDLDTRGRLEQGDIDKAAQFTFEQLGDPAYVDNYDPQAHGSGEQRVNSLLSGYQDGFLGCNIKM